jgi:Cys-tRNA(Pro)/Cys-tRNA(Cys) deacylase
MIPVNNVIRLLESRHIPFTVFETPTGELSAQGTADFLKVPVELVYKTIVIKREKIRKPILAIVSGHCKVDLKLLATLLGEKKLFLPTVPEAEQITGLQTGGISPLALINKGFTMVLDESASTHDEIHVSGGQRGLNLRIKVNDLLSLTDARLGKISQLI